MAKEVVITEKSTKKAHELYQAIVVQNVIADLRFPFPLGAYHPCERPEWYPDVSDVYKKKWANFTLLYSRIAQVPFATLGERRITDEPKKKPMALRKRFDPNAPEETP